MKDSRFSDTINHRFVELMKRDPLVTGFLKEYGEFVKENPEILRHTGMSMTDHLNLLSRQLSDKWGPWCFEYGPDGSFKVQKIGEKVTEHRPVKMFSDLTIPEDIRRRQCDVFPAMRDHIYLDVDLSTLDAHDEKIVKNEVWRIVQARLFQKRKTLKGTKPARPQDDPPELGFVYHIKEPVFRNYLRWYDIHIQEKVSFRLMAKIESFRKENVEAYDEWLDRARTARIKIGCTIKGEDRVEKGVKLLWAAIHREPYSSGKVEPVVEEWSCPQHGKNYDGNCRYCKSLYDRFDRVYSMSKGYMEPFDQEVLELISSPYPARKGRRTSDQG